MFRTVSKKLKSSMLFMLCMSMLKLTTKQKIVKHQEIKATNFLLHILLTRELL